MTERRVFFLSLLAFVAIASALVCHVPSYQPIVAIPPLPAQKPEPKPAELAFDPSLEYEPPVPYEDMAGLDVETQREMVQRDRIDRLEARVRRLETELSAVISRVFGISGEIGSEGE